MPMLDDQEFGDGPVLVIGAAGVDLVGRTQTRLQAGTSNPAEIRSSYGGVARNVAENLARFGQPVRLLSAVGDDDTGERLLQQASSAGVDTSAVLKTGEYATGAYLALVNPEGELQFALDDMRITQAITADYLRGHEAFFRQASLIFVDGNLSPRALRTVFSLAKKAKKPVCADPTTTSLAPRFTPYLDRLLLITPNHKEASIFCGYEIDINDDAQVQEAARYLVGQGVGLVVITLGEHGLCYATSETWGTIPAIRTEVVDPTGAGDALSATLIFGLLNDIPLDDAVRLGVSAASLTLRHRGAVRADLSLEQLYNHLVF